MASKIISISNLCIAFDNHSVIKNLNLEVGQGDKISVIGGSGSGKSILIKSIIGLINRSAGSISINNVEINSNVEENVKKHDIGMTFQNDGLFDSMSIFDNLLFPLIQKKIAGKDESKKIVNEIVEKIRLSSGVLKKYPSELSGGMRKRIAVARVIITKPSIIFFDEPTTGLDPITSQSIIDIIDSYIKKDGVTSIVVTHSMKCVKQLSDRVLMIKDGKLLLYTNTDELSSSKNEYVQDFLKYS